MLRGLKVNLRPIRESDLGPMMDWDDDSEIIAYLGKKFLSRDTCLTWFSALSGSRGHRAMAIERPDGRLIGSIELEHIDWRGGRAELSICIGEKDCWSKGFGTDAIRVFTDFAFRRLHLDHIYLRVYRGNQRAIRCYEKCGFRKEGLLKRTERQMGRHDDLVLMSLRRAQTELHLDSPYRAV